MKTTLNISDVAMYRLKAESVRQGRTMSELVESALRMLFMNSKKQTELPPLPKFNSGGSRVDLENREALFQVMEGE